MKRFKTATIERYYNNFGQHAEQAVAFTLTGEIRSHGKLPYDAGSDIPEYFMSVKSSKFSLMSGNVCEAQDFEGIVEEFFRKTASRYFAYVTQDMECFVMDVQEFRNFVHQFCILSRESTSNGGRNKVQMRKESKKVLRWLEVAVA